MNGLRDTIYGSVTGDSFLLDLGFSQANVYANFSALTDPEEDAFIVLRWGTLARGVGLADSVDLAIWVYERDPDYSRISDTLRRCRALIPGLVGASTGDGWILGVEITGDSDDFYDESWKRYTRNGTYRITASGL